MKFLSKIIEYGLYILVFLLPWQSRWIIKTGLIDNGPWEYGTYGLYGTDVLSIILLLLFVVHLIWHNKFSIFNPPAGGQFSNSQTNKRLKFVWLFIWGLAVVALVSVFFASDYVLALYKFGWLILGIGLFWLIVEANYNKLKLIWCLLSGLAIQAGLAIWQFLAQTAWANKWLGLAVHRAADLGASVVEIAGQSGQAERWLRAYGGFDHPNILGGAMAAGILLLIQGAVESEKYKNFQKIFNRRIFKAINWLLLLIFSAALFFSFSRSAWLALAAGLAALAVRSFLKKDLLLQKVLSQAFLIMGTLGLVFFLIYPDLVMTRVPYLGNSAPARLEIKSTEERLESLKYSWLIIKSHPIAGIGIGNYTLSLYRETKPPRPSYFYQPAHNVYALVLSELGIFGLIFFLGLIIRAIILSFRTGDNKNGRRLSVGGAIIIVLAVIFFFDHWPWSLHFGVLFFWLALGLAALKRIDNGL